MGLLLSKLVLSWFISTFAIVLCIKLWFEYNYLPQWSLFKIIRYAVLISTLINIMVLIVVILINLP